MCHYEMAWEEHYTEAEEESRKADLMPDILLCRSSRRTLMHAIAQNPAIRAYLVRLHVLGRVDTPDWIHSNEQADLVEAGRRLTALRQLADRFRSETRESLERGDTLDRLRTIQARELTVYQDIANAKEQVELLRKNGARRAALCDTLHDAPAGPANPVDADIDAHAGPTRAPTKRAAAPPPARLLHDTDRQSRPSAM
jgi:hypothetical protein